MSMLMSMLWRTLNREVLLHTVCDRYNLQQDSVRNNHLIECCCPYYSMLISTHSFPPAPRRTPTPGPHPRSTPPHDRKQELAEKEAK